jgi:hypothetical protein
MIKSTDMYHVYEINKFTYFFKILIKYEKYFKYLFKYLFLCIKKYFILNEVNKNL